MAALTVVVAHGKATFQRVYCRPRLQSVMSVHHSLNKLTFDLYFLYVWVMTIARLGLKVKVKGRGKICGTVRELIDGRSSRFPL